MHAHLFGDLKNSARQSSLRERPQRRRASTDSKNQRAWPQRLTALYAVIKGINVIRENYNSEPIEIAFSPLQNKFDVADAAIRRDSAYIPNISGIWNSNLFEFVAKYLKTLSAVREGTDEERQQIQSAISRLFSLLSYPFTALELTNHQFVSFAQRDASKIGSTAIFMKSQRTQEW